MPSCCSDDMSAADCADYLATGMTARDIPRFYAQIASVLGLPAATVFFTSHMPWMRCGSLIVTLPIKGVDNRDALISHLEQHFVGDQVSSGVEVYLNGTQLNFFLFMGDTSTSSSTTGATTVSTRTTSSSSTTLSSTITEPGITAVSTVTTQRTTTAVLLPPADVCAVTAGATVQDCHANGEICCTAASEARLQSKGWAMFTMRVWVHVFVRSVFVLACLFWHVC